jgi:hypothetical protein
MLKIKDKLGKIIAILKDKDIEPEATEDNVIPVNFKNKSIQEVTTTISSDDKDK